MTIRDRKLINKLFYFEKQITITSIKLVPYVEQLGYFIVPFDIKANGRVYSFRKVVIYHELIESYPYISWKQLEYLFRNIDIHIEKRILHNI